MARFTVLTIALCSAVAFLLGAVLSGRSVSAPAPAVLVAEPARDAPVRTRAAAVVPGAVNFADVAERINASVVNIDAASRVGRDSRRRRNSDDPLENPRDFEA